MLERFGTLWVGQVHHDGLGFDAPAVNDRRYDDAHLATPMASSEQIAQLMDRCGYDTMWLAEHHFQHEGYECIPNIPLLATHLAGQTERLRFGCGFNVLPTWHPLRLAEDYAMADILTKGRVRLGVGRGYHSREVALLRHPDATDDDARELFEEQVALLLTALREDSFSFKGRYYQVPPGEIPYRGYTLEEITLVPKPQYSTECWQPIVSATDRALDFMIEHGIKGFVGGGAASGGASQEVAERWQAKLAEHGRDTELGTDLIFGFSFLLADTVADAKQLGRPILEEYQKMFAPLGFAGNVSDEQLAALGDPATAAQAGMGTIDDAVDAGSWLVGPAEGLIETFGVLQETYPGLEEIMVAQPVGAHPSTVMEQLERFAEGSCPLRGWRRFMKIGVGLWCLQSTATAPRSFTAAYRDLIDDAQLAERVGIHSLWLSEHHAYYDGYCPSLLPAAAAALASTETLRVGTGVLLLPLQDPQRVAAAAAQLDARSGGRFHLGMGMGYRPVEFEAKGLDMKDRVRRMNAGLDVMAATRPSPMWVGVTSEAAARRAGRRGLGLFISGAFSKEVVETLVAAHRSAWDDAGRPGGERPKVGALRNLWIADDERSRRRALDWVRSSYLVYAGLGWGADDTGVDFVAQIDASMDEVEASATVGSAEQIAEELSRYDVDLVVCRIGYDQPPRSALTEVVERIGNELVPLLDGVGA